MSIIIFVVALVLLILVHEFGHFIAAKKSGIRVDEFGLGFPPRAFGKKIGETIYSINWLPFGGFVKIFGENPADSELETADKSTSLIGKPRYIQAMVLVAGVTFNVIFAWILISIGFMSGLPVPVGYSGYDVENQRLTVVNVLPSSPASEAGINIGDTVLEIRAKDAVYSDTSSDEVHNFIRSNSENDMVFLIDKKGEINVTPKEGIIADTKAVGISMETIGTLQLNPALALWEGGKTTIKMTYAVAVGLGDFIWSAVRAKADLSQVTGPVGIVGMVGDARELGFGNLLSFVAIISLHLAVINLLPFPALDGGRLLFVAIEAVIRRNISPKISATINSIGFLLLIALMLIVTWNDVVKLF